MTTETAVEREPQDIDHWFELTYANYHVLPRTLMQSMPLDWQHRATALFDELAAAFDHIPHPEYRVTTGRWHYVSDLSDAELKRLGVSTCCDDVPPDKDIPADHRCEYYLEGDELDQHSASVFVPGRDPIPHYARGRTHVKRMDELAAEKETAAAG